MQMAASAFDILIGSVSDNIGLRWVWTNQRCNRTACIHRMQFKGLGFPNKHFATQKVFLYRRKHCLQMQTLYIRLPCLRVLWSFSMCFLVWKSFCNQDRQLSSSTWSWRLFFCSGSFRVCNRSKQGELVPTHDFWIWFYKSDFKNDCWASPKPDIQHINCADCVS